MQRLAVVQNLDWQVYDADGKLIAMCRYAIDAARIALPQGAGATIRHGDKVALSVKARTTTWEAADDAACSMIAAAYGEIGSVVSANDP
jgi:hypothetical protein